MSSTISAKDSEESLKKESLELMADKEFMKDYLEATRQVRDREFADWDELQDSTN